MSMTARLIRLERDSGGWLLKFTCGDRGVFQFTVDEIKDRVPWNAREWLPDEKSWWIDGPYLTSVGFLFSNFAAMRARQSTRQSTTAPQTNNAMIPDKVRAAFATIHLLPDAPPEVVKAAYRACAVLRHPDHGGTTEIMQQINLGYELAYQWSLTHRTG